MIIIHSNLTQNAAVLAGGFNTIYWLFNRGYIFWDHPVGLYATYIFFYYTEKNAYSLSDVV